MTAVYQEAIPTAELTLTGAVDIIENGATMDYWEALLKNTGEAPLTTIKIKPTATGGWHRRTQHDICTRNGSKHQSFSCHQRTMDDRCRSVHHVGSAFTSWRSIKMNLLGTAVTGNPGQVLTADVEVSATLAV